MVKNKQPYRIIASLMAFLMFFTSVSFSMEAHYCQGHLKGVSLFGETRICNSGDQAAKPSHCQKMKMTCHQEPDGELKDCLATGCCESEKIIVDAIDESFTFSPAPELTEIQFQFVTAFILTTLLPPAQKFSTPHFQLYRPPIPDVELHILLQTFLI